MSTHPATRDADPATRLGGALTQTLLSFATVYAVSYVVANDVIAASLHERYSRLDQAVSELSAVGAPSAAFLRAMLPIFTALTWGFAAGVWRAARGSRALRVTSLVLFASGVVGVLWLWFPMTARADMVAGTMAGNDVGHLVLSGATVVLILLRMGFGAAALGPSFRVFSLVCAVTLLGCGAGMSVSAAALAEGDPTRWMGLLERLMLGAWLAWDAALGVVLMRRLQRDAPR